MRPKADVWIVLDQALTVRRIFTDTELQVGPSHAEARAKAFARRECMYAVRQHAYYTEEDLDKYVWGAGRSSTQMGDTEHDHRD